MCSANSGPTSAANCIASNVEGKPRDPAASVESLERRLREATAALEHARAELAQWERLALIGQIAVAIGHELRQPLSVINNVAYCLRLICQEKSGGEKEASSGPSAAALPQLDRLESQVALANRIISNLMDYARSQQPNRRPIDLNRLVEEQFALLEIPRQIRWKKQLAMNLAPALADPFHLERILHNLVANAVESMRSSGGELCLRTFAEEGGVVLEVSDTGPGIPDELREKIFRPFFSSRSGGVGLGLALARHLTEANQGSIQFRSEPGRGACFQVRLPAAERPE